MAHAAEAGDERLRNLFDPAMPVAPTVPECCWKPEQCDEQIARIKITAGEWLLFNALDRQRHDTIEADLLPDE